jgi:hypothetical protein
VQDLGVLVNMVSKCGPQILACVTDPTCKAALDCLQACDPTDQVQRPTRIPPLNLLGVTAAARTLIPTPGRWRQDPSVPLQVCSYQCIVSNETEKLEDFTLCVLQVTSLQDNCLTSLP